MINSHNYKIIDKILENDFSKIYKVLNEKEKKYYYIKQISINNLGEEEIKYIQDEVKFFSNCNIQHTIKYINSFKDNNNYNILMEYYDGSFLNKFIKKYKNKNKFIEEDIIYNIILDLCLGIKEIHENNLIHRDLKPENIFITKDNKIKINDFGISKKFKYKSALIGTNKYMAPEMIKGEKYNNKIDIWALGCIIYELFTLKMCFQGENLFDIVNKIINEKHGKIDENKYNYKWQWLIDLLLKKKYEERPDINKVYELIKNEIKNNIKNEILNYSDKIGKSLSEKKVKKIGCDNLGISKKYILFFI